MVYLDADPRNVDCRFEGVRRTMLALIVPLGGGSFSAVWPKGASASDHEAMIESFLGSVGAVWGDEEYSQQDERFVCHPKIWFRAGR
jgi:hypothetical protein